MDLMETLLNPVGAGATAFVIFGILYPLVILVDQIKHNRHIERRTYWMAWSASPLVLSAMLIVFMFARAPMRSSMTAVAGAIAGLILAGGVLWLLRNRLSFAERRTFVILPGGKKRLARD